MNTPVRWMIVLLSLLAPASGALAAGTIEYYVWTDEQGVTHASGTPPEGVDDYEIRTLDPDQNLVVDPDRSTGGNGAPDGAGQAGGGGGEPSGTVADEGLSGAGKAILLDDALEESEPAGDSQAQEQELSEQRLLERGDPGGGAQAPRGNASQPTPSIPGPAPPGGSSPPAGPTAPAF